MAKPETRYVVIIDGEPGALGLWVPDMPRCTSIGGTLDELLQNAQEALRMWAEDAPADEEFRLLHEASMKLLTTRRWRKP